MSAPAHVLEVDQDVPVPREIGVLPIPKILTALQLHQIDLAGPGILATQALPPWASFGISMRPIPIRSDPIGSRTITRAQFEEACRTAVLLERYHLDSPDRPSELALHRFTLGCGRIDASDALLDFAIALEALLLPYDRETRSADLSYRFRVHGALFITDSHLERRSIFRALRTLYDFRSRLVHGADYPEPTELLAAASDAKRLAAGGLLKAVRNGFPDAAEFGRMVLGETPTPVAG
jgi:hypothetical protein